MLNDFSSGLPWEEVCCAESHHTDDKARRDDLSTIGSNFLIHDLLFLPISAIGSRVS